MSAAGPRKIAVLTSGGDAPGLNACIRAVVRTALHHGLKVLGVHNGFEGLIDGEFSEMDAASVSNILQRGGTVLKTARSERFKSKAGRRKAISCLKREGVDALIVIGGDGSLRGTDELARESGVACIGIPKTIDNDISGTDSCIGFDTALNTALSAIDKIRDTAESHNRLYFIEVMGNKAGYIAAYSGLAAGAEGILIPELARDEKALFSLLRKGWRRKKTSLIAIVAEGDESGGAIRAAAKAKELFPAYDIRTCILGHIQRGGSPTAADRILASELGYAAVEAVLNGRRNVMVGKVNKEIVYTPVGKVEKRTMNDPSILRLMDVLSA